MIFTYSRETATGLVEDLMRGMISIVLLHEGGSIDGSVIGM